MDHMKRNRYTHAYPPMTGGPVAEKKTWDLQAGYVQRSLNQLPKSSTKRPWVVRQDYWPTRSTTDSATRSTRTWCSAGLYSSGYST